MVAALLITHHLITLTDLYPYLSPDDAEMASEYEAWKAKLEDQAAGSSGTNLLAMMGSLEDLGVDEDALDSLDLDALISNATLSKSANSDSKSAVNQKALLCSHLFSLGNIPLALWFVRRFPFIPAINTNVADHLNHLLDIIVDPYYQHIRWHPFFVAGPEREQPRYRDYALTPSVGVLKQARHAGRDRRYLALTRAYPAYSFASNNSKFFYAEYAEDPAPPTPALEPSPTGFTALLPRIKPWLDVLGPRLARDPRLLTKLIRIGKACLNGCREGVRAAEDSRSPKTASQPLPTEGQNGGEGRMEIEAPEQPEVEGKLAAARTEEERVTQTWITALEKWIIPAYTQVSSSPGMASELWALLSKLPYQTRYGIYSRWRTHIYKSSVELKAAEKTAQREVRTLMRMLSTETVRDVSRKLCRFCHSNPLPCLRIVLDQICSYDNLIVLAVDALRYLTKLDTDVLTYLILETLDDSPKAAQRLRLKEDGINAAHWLQSLATFIGTYFRKYPIPQLRYIIEFLARRMTASVNSLPSLQPSPAAPSRGTDRSGFLVYEMIIFGELIQKMAVIESTSRPSDSQIKAMQGGPLLRLESHEMAGSFSTQCQNNILVRLGNKPTVQLPTHNSIRRAIKQLAHELLQAPLSRPLFLGLSIQAHYLLLPLHPSEGSPVPREDHPRRVLTIFYDRMMEMAGQFTQFARAYFTQNELEALIPSLAQLRRDYGLEWAACWHWARLYFSGSLANAITEWAKHQKIERTKSQDGDADNGNGKMPAENGGPHEGTSIPEKTTGETDASTDKTEEQADEATPHVSEPVTNAGDSSDAANLIPDDSVSQPIKELNREVVEFVKQHLPESDTLACFSADFYTLFWTLSISDIRVPKERYQQEIARLKAFCHSVEAALAQSSSKDREAEREFYRVRNLIPSMEKELADHEQHVKDVRAWLASYKRSLFNKPDAIVFAKAFFKYCIFPRAKFSPLDAVYCASMIELLQHPLGADNFPTLFVYNLIFDHPMHELLGSMTDNEARCYAKFLNQCLTTLDRWRITRYLFELEGRKNGKSAGFMCVITPTKGSQRLQSPSGPETKRPPPTRILEHEELRRIVFKWHIRLGESFTMCLASDDTQKIRNALLSMHELAQVFPAVKTIGQDLLGKLSKLIEQYKDNKNYDDLVTLARSYYSAISKNQENWSTQYEFSGIEQQQQPPPPPPQPSKLESSSQKRRHEREQRDSGRLSSHRREAHGTADIRADHERPLSASSTRESRHSSRDGRDRPRRQDRVDSRERLSSSNHYRSTGGVDDARGSSARDRREAAGGHSSRAERQPSSRRGDEVPSELDRAPNPHRESRQEWSRRDDREPAQPPPPPQK
ncbi:THO2 plays a role in transcriptional elongation, partial [Spiromyces aspiralis]